MQKRRFVECCESVLRTVGNRELIELADLLDVRGRLEQRPRAVDVDNGRRIVHHGRVGTESRPHVVVREAERVADLVRGELAVALEHRILDLVEESRGLTGALGGVAVGLDKTQAHEGVLPPTQRAEDNMPLEDLSRACSHTSSIEGQVMQAGGRAGGQAGG